MLMRMELMRIVLALLLIYKAIREILKERRYILIKKIKKNKIIKS
jgi:hypothetical protein